MKPSMPTIRLSLHLRLRRSVGCTLPHLGRHTSRPGSSLSAPHQSTPSSFLFIRGPFYHLQIASGQQKHFPAMNAFHVKCQIRRRRSGVRQVAEDKHVLVAIATLGGPIPPSQRLPRQSRRNFKPDSHRRQHFHRELLPAVVDHGIHKFDRVLGVRQESPALPFLQRGQVDSVKVRELLLCEIDAGAKSLQELTEIRAISGQCVRFSQISDESEVIRGDKLTIIREYENISENPLDKSAIRC